MGAGAVWVPPAVLPIYVLPQLSVYISADTQVLILFLCHSASLSHVVLRPPALALGALHILLVLCPVDVTCRPSPFLALPSSWLAWYFPILALESAIFFFGGRMVI